MRIIIVGAGPIGCYLGHLLKKQGFSPLILEEHAEIGLPKHCAGLVGSSFFNKSKIALPKDIIKKQLNGAIVTYENQSFTLQRKEAAFVIDRENLDKKLALGLDVQKETKIIGLEKQGKQYSLHTNKGVFRTHMVIGADGARSKVRELSGFKLKPTYYKGIQFRIKQNLAQTDMVQIYFIKPFLHFYWIIPEAENVVRVGSISPPGSTNELNRFIEKMNLRGEILEKTGGFIAVGYGEIVRDGIALVGDAACQVKPLSGGGLYCGMRSAEILADCIAKKDLLAYAARWKKEIGTEIRSALRIKKILDKTNVKILEKLFRLAQKNSNLIEEFADFEHHSISVFSVMKNLGLSFSGAFIKLHQKNDA